MKRNPAPKSRKVLKVLILVFALLLIVPAAGFYIYTLDYYRSDASVNTILNEVTTATQLQVVQSGSNTYFIPPASIRNGQGIVFYPGGKVEAKAYSPLLLKLSEKGYTTVLVEMPFNLAVFNSKGALKAIDKLQVISPDTTIDAWSIAGHSLGGAMASSLMDKEDDKFSNLILLAAYPLNDSNIPTIAIYGSEDRVLSSTEMDKADQVLELPGGNHAYFGNYGEQEGDGQATLSREEQQALTVEGIHNFIQSTKP